MGLLSLPRDLLPMCSTGNDANTAPLQDKFGHCAQPVPKYWMAQVLDEKAVFIEESAGI